MTRERLYVNEHKCSFAVLLYINQNISFKINKEPCG